MLAACQRAVSADSAPPTQLSLHPARRLRRLREHEDNAFAESAETARWVEGKLGIAWPGTEPNASDRLEKIGFKQICDKVGGVVR